MTYLTPKDIMDRARRDTDTVNEPDVTDQMLVDWLNDAIDIAESNILTLYEDYFLTKTTLGLVAAQEDYDLSVLLPNLYAGKIRSIMYHNAGTVYPIARLRARHLMETVELIKQFGSAERYQYILRNDAASAGFTLELLPASRETGNYMVVRYIRNAVRVVLATITTQKVDIPEWSPFVIAYVKMMLAKHAGHPMMDQYDKDQERLKAEMIDSLSAMTPDDDNLVLADTDLYEEHA